MMAYINPNIESSYREHNLGKTLYQEVMTHKPDKIVEIGCLFGYSSVAMGQALRDLEKGKLFVYDLFDKYKYKHSSKNETQANLENYGVADFVELVEMDFEEWVKNPEQFDMLHFDISNNGDKLLKLYSAVQDQIHNGARVYFEGGSIERDNVEWMAKYDFKKINDSGINYVVINEKFPSLSLITLNK